MKCLLVNLCDEEYEDLTGCSDKEIRTYAVVRAFKSKKTLLKSLRRNWHYEDGKRPNFKTFKEYSNEWGHCMWVFPYSYLKYVVEYYRISEYDVDLRGIK